VDTLVIWVAQYLLFAMAAGLALVWLLAEDRRGKVDLAAEAAVGIVLMLIFLYVANSVHSDPRPFVSDPHVKPLFSHAADNGFPSDHSIAAGLIAMLVLIRHRLLGLLFVGAAVAIAWARVDAHVHHLQDVVAGLLLGGLAAVLAALAVRLVRARLDARAAQRGQTGATR
jgi:undecaprenyl-diphosphatase